MIKIAIVDDSKRDSLLLSKYIHQYSKENQLYTEIIYFKSGEEFLSSFTLHKFDIIFLDIYMEEMDGIATATKIREIDCKCLIIFSTSSLLHAVDGFRVRAFDYLVKPYDYKKFIITMDLCKQTLMKNSYFIEVKEKRIMVKILINEIMYVDYFNHYIQIHTEERLIKSYMKFSNFSPLILFYSQFLCCYRNCIINMDKVDCIDKNDFLMQNGDRIPIRKNDTMIIKQTYADYQFEKLNNGGM